MKKISFIIALLLIFILVLTISGCSKAAAVVNGEKISDSDIDAYFNFFKSQDTEGALEQDQATIDNVQSNILDSLIVIKLLKQYAQEEGISVSQEELDTRYQEIIETYGSREEFEQALESMSVDEEFLRNELENQILRTKIFDMVTAGIEVSEEEAADFYEQNKQDLFLVPEKVEVSHILARFELEEGQTEITEQEKQSAMDKIEFVQQELEEGRSFEEVALEYSDDTASAENGGGLGYISRGEMAEEFENIAFALQVGEVSDIVETVYGYHILKVTDKQDEYIKEYDEVRETVITYMESENKNAAWSDFVYGLIDGAEIEYNTEIKSQLTPEEEIEEGQE
ncbi:MAG: peptidylprolyl isomerase [Actinomycetia bacterium]|nr:peptidylprolyl isomerase [Actinomycetes bacterium]